jgi:Ca2+-dependent lipid-binding protein
VLVSITSAADLALPNGSATACSAYVSVSLVDTLGTEVTGEVKQTKVRARTSAPSWDETFVLGEVANVTDGTIRAKIFHKEGGAFSPPVALGRVEVPLSMLPPNGLPINRTLPLQPTSAVKDPKGTLTMTLKWDLPEPSRAASPGLESEVMRFRCGRHTDAQATQQPVSDWMTG